MIKLLAVIKHLVNAEHAVVDKKLSIFFKDPKVDKRYQICVIKDSFVDKEEQMFVVEDFIGDNYLLNIQILNDNSLF